MFNYQLKNVYFYTIENTTGFKQLMLYNLIFYFQNFLGLANYSLQYENFVSHQTSIIITA